MTKAQYRMTALALAALTAIAGMAAFFSSGDAVTNTFGSSTLEIRVREPHWKDDPTIVPEQKIDKDPYIENTDETPAYVFMQVTVPAQEVMVEQADTDKGALLTSEVQTTDKNGQPVTETVTVHTVPLFRFINSDGAFTDSQLSSSQTHNTGWYYMGVTENKDASDKTTGFTYLYAYTGSNTDDTMAVLYPKDMTATPLFNQVLFCNAREDDQLPGSVQSIAIEVFGIQTDFLKSSSETESKAERVWAYLSA